MLISSSIQIEDGISQKVRKNKDTNEIVKKYETFYINSNGYQGRCNSLEEAKQLKESFKKRPSKQKEYFEKVKEKSNQRLEKMKKRICW